MTPSYATSTFTAPNSYADVGGPFIANNAIDTSDFPSELIQLPIGYVTSGKSIRRNQTDEA
jgi:hypothetical protein